MSSPCLLRLFSCHHLICCQTPVAAATPRFLQLQIDDACDEKALQPFHPTNSAWVLVRHLISAGSIHNVNLSLHTFYMENEFESGDVIVDRITRYARRRVKPFVPQPALICAPCTPHAHSSYLSMVKHQLFKIVGKVNNDVTSSNPKIWF